VGHGCGEANKQLTDSKRGVTGDNPTHNRPIVGRSIFSILGNREIPFLGSRKKIDTGDFGVSLTSLIIV